MLAPRLPTLATDEFAATRDALHAYSRILGDWLKTCRPKRKHWWHASLRPSLRGLSTGVVQVDGLDFELELDLYGCRLLVRSAEGEDWRLDLRGQPAAEVAAWAHSCLLEIGLDRAWSPEVEYGGEACHGFSVQQAEQLGLAIAGISAVLREMRAAIREETSPIGLWPHHFDLAMLWLPGGKIPGQDPADEEYADKQMNFGFAFGDDLVTEPYCYATVYPRLDEFPQAPLAEGAEWHSDDFTGLVWRYARLCRNPDPAQALLSQWQALLEEGRQKLDD